MDVKFIIRAECRADDIDIKRTAGEIKKELESCLYDLLGIRAVVEVSGLTYVEKRKGRKNDKG